MGRFKSWLSSFLPPGTTVTSRTFIPVGIFEGWGWDTVNNSQYAKDFNEVPEVSAILNAKARAFSNMKLSVVSKTSGEEVKNTNPDAKILRKPNWFQGQKEFLMQTKLFREVYGNEYPYKLIPVGMEPVGLFTLPPNMVEIKIDNKTAYWLMKEKPDDVQYITTFNNVKQVLPNESFIHLNDNNATVNEKNYLSGVSKLQALQMPIQNIRAAYEARNVLITKRGALGMLSNNSGDDAIGTAAPFDAVEKKDLQEQMKKYGLTKSQFQFILTSLNLKWTQMAVDADKLRLFEEVMNDTVKISDAYGYPFELLGSEKGTTFRNKEFAERQLYQDTIIPEALEWVIGMNRLFNTLEGSFIITATYDHLPIFKEDMKLKAETLERIVNALSTALEDGVIDEAFYKLTLEQFNL